MAAACSNLPVIALTGSRRLAEAERAHEAKKLSPIRIACRLIDKFQPAIWRIPNEAARSILRAFSLGISLGRPIIPWYRPCGPGRTVHAWRSSPFIRTWSAARAC